jgi:ATP-dependent protease HslVU (ClpYQ) ATPase subunit
LNEIKECQTTVIDEKLKEVQKIIGDFDLHDASNLEMWVGELNVKIENILVRRLETLLESWVEEFKDFQKSGG